MQIYFHSCLSSYLPRVPILVEGTVYLNIFFCVSQLKKKDINYFWMNDDKFIFLDQLSLSTSDSNN